MADEKDYIGFDPVAWVGRLREVNRGSQFPDRDKAVISMALEQLQQKLEAAACVEDFIRRYEPDAPRQ